jgi:hypothetical protein
MIFVSEIFHNLELLSPQSLSSNREANGLQVSKMFLSGRAEKTQSDPARFEVKEINADASVLKRPP